MSCGTLTASGSRRDGRQPTDAVQTEAVLRALQARSAFGRIDYVVANARAHEAAGYDMESLEMTRDETGVILNFVGRNKVETFVRVDDAEQPNVPQLREAVDPRLGRAAKLS